MGTVVDQIDSTNVGSILPKFSSDGATILNQEQMSMKYTMLSSTGNQWAQPAMQQDTSIMTGATESHRISVMETSRKFLNHILRSVYQGSGSLEIDFVFQAVNSDSAWYSFLESMVVGYPVSHMAVDPAPVQQPELIQEVERLAICFFYILLFAYAWQIADDSSSFAKYFSYPNNILGVEPGPDGFSTTTQAGTDYPPTPFNTSGLGDPAIQAPFVELCRITNEHDGLISGSIRELVAETDLGQYADSLTITITPCTPEPSQPTTQESSDTNIPYITPYTITREPRVEDCATLATLITTPTPITAPESSAVGESQTSITSTRETETGISDTHQFERLGECGVAGPVLLCVKPETPTNVRKSLLDSLFAPYRGMSVIEEVISYNRSDDAETLGASALLRICTTIGKADT